MANPKRVHISKIAEARSLLSELSPKHPQDLRKGSGDVIGGESRCKSNWK